MQYLKKEVRDEVVFLHADEQTIPQVNTIDFCAQGVAFPKLPKITSLQNSLQYLKKEVRDEVYFLYRLASQLSIN